MLYIEQIKRNHFRKQNIAFLCRILIDFEQKLKVDEHAHIFINIRYNMHCPFVKIRGDPNSGALGAEIHVKPRLIAFSTPH